MKIAFYANEITNPQSSGVKAYSLEIIKHLLEEDPTNEYVLYSQEDIASEVGSDRAEYAVSGPGKRFWAFSVFPKLIGRDCPDVVFMPIQTFPFFNFGKRKPKTVVTVHDLAFLLFPGHFTYARRKLLEFHTRRCAKKADHIIVPSEATKRDIMRFYGTNKERISVIPHSYRENLVRMAENRAEDAKRKVQGRPYVLFVGSVQPRKNIARLAQAFALLKEMEANRNLVLVILGGKGWMWKEIYSEISKNPSKEDIIFVEDADDGLLASFYRNAEFLVMPSLYEGFGLPVLEAMSFGLPVICANNSSLSEVAGGAALLCDGYDAVDMSEKMKMLISSQSLKAELSAKSLQRAKDFSWARAARQTLEVLEKVYKK